MAEYCQLWLSCANSREADRIANTLLVKRLIACAKQLPVKADYRWKGEIESADEIILMMESRLDLFERVEEEVARLHSYQTIVLEATPIVKVSSKASGWLKESINDQ